MKSKFNVLIIGAGKIGAIFDNPKSRNIITHAHAFSFHKGFNLVGFVDNDRKRSSAAAKMWNVRAYADLEGAFKYKSIDVVSIAASTNVHQKLLEKVLKYPVKLVLLEKPIAKTLSESKKIIKFYNDTKIPIVVNYIRRFLPEFEKIKTDIRKGSYGNFVAGTGYYGGGLLNNGSHIIDLLLFFFGRISGIKVINSYNNTSADDPTITAVFRLSNKKIFILQGINSKSPGLFEIDLIFENQRIRIIESGLKIEFYVIQNSNIFKGYRSMIKSSEHETSLGNYMYYVADNIYKHLTKGEVIKCDILDGYKASELCFNILEKSS
jgi:predicted dehydrogenase